MYISVYYIFGARGWLGVRVRGVVCVWRGFGDGVILGIIYERHIGGVGVPAGMGCSPRAPLCRSSHTVHVCLLSLWFCVTFCVTNVLILTRPDKTPLSYHHRSHLHKDILHQSVNKTLFQWIYTLYRLIVIVSLCKNRMR